MHTVSELTDGNRGTVELEILSFRKIPMRRRGKFMYEARCRDATGTLNLKWFYFHKGLETKVKPGARVIATGTVKNFMSRAEIVHPT